MKEPFSPEQITENKKNRACTRRSYTAETCKQKQALVHTRKNPPAGQRKRRCPAAYTPRLDCFSKIPYYLQLQQSLATIFFFSA